MTITTPIRTKRDAKYRRKRLQRIYAEESEKISKLVSALIVRNKSTVQNTRFDDDDIVDSDGNPSYKVYVIPRVRTTMLAIRQKLTKDHFRRAYRMTYDRLVDLVALLSPELAKTRSIHYRRNAVNGPISDELRVSMTLRFLAGGSVYDIALVYGTAVSTVYQIVGQVLDAIDKCPSLDITFPADHEEQARIAAEFKEISDAQFDCCIGVIDGMLVWTEKPSESDCLAWNHLQSGSFFCGRKSKFGFNMQAVADAKLRFLEVWISSPASASDYISYLTSPFYAKLSRKGFLKEGSALFGDNAYVSNEFMATPYKSARRGPQDDYNFFQSQIRIRIEMAFGMLTRRWGILRKPLSSSFGIKKQLQITMACCKLHNFCLGKSEEGPLVPLLDRDEYHVQLHGQVYMGQVDDVQNLAAHLLDGGNHFDDAPDHERPSDIIRKRLREQVEGGGFHRPSKIRAT